MSNIKDPADNISTTKRALLALEEMQSKLKAMERLKTEPIAIIGLGCRFPGGVTDAQSFWKLMHDEVDAITEIPSNRWITDDYYDSDPEKPGKIYTRHGGFIDAVDRFDAEFFGISPREASDIDPQQRLMLEVAWEALENAGQAPDRLVETSTGVFVGIMTGDYSKLVVKSNESSHIDAYYTTGNEFSFSAGRISYLLGLQGPALAVDTACSSSMVAIHLACQSLRLQESNLAIAGGVNLILSPELTISLSKFKALSADGRCKTFDAAADGFGRGEGCGAVVLKRLSDAVADRDNILALIRGSAVNQDGPSGGLTVPNGIAQQSMLRQAIANAGVEPAQVNYVEAHGTGTPLGDPIEVQALATVLCDGRPADKPLTIGSVKTNIGHLDSAAGIAGLIKVVLSLQKGEIPAHLHFNKLNPHISLEGIPVTIPTNRTPWTSGDERRIAGVSSFGFSGTNAHAVVEEAPAIEVESPQVERPQHILTISAKSDKALKELAQRYVLYLSSGASASLGDICFTANTGRAHFEHRLAAVAESSEQLREKLEGFTAGHESSDVLRSQAKVLEPPKVAFIFTGQGSQYAGMGRQLYDTQPTFRRVLDRCDELMRSHLERPLLSVMFPESGSSSLLNETAYTQPALFALEYALAELWRSWGIEPSVVAGHSVGEYVAACVAGVFSLEDGLKLIAERGRLIQGLPPNGSMAAVFANEARLVDAIGPYAGSVSIAAVNSPTETVISGAREEVASVVAAMGSEGIDSRMLKVSHAFHSHLMEPMLDAFERTAGEVSYAVPQIGLISNVIGELVSGSEVSQAAYWRRHVREPVRFLAGLQALHRQGHALFVEVGPQPILSGMGMRCLPEAMWLPSLRKTRGDWPQMLESLGQLYGQCVGVDWRGFDRNYVRRKVVLPTYPFQHRRYWMESAEAGVPIEKTIPKESVSGTILHPLLGRQLHSPLKEIQFETRLSADNPSFIAEHKVYGAVVMPGTAYVEMTLAAACAAFEGGRYWLEEVSIQEALVLPEGTSAARTVQLILKPDGSEKTSFQIVSLKEDGNWKTHAIGEVILGEDDGVVFGQDDGGLAAAQKRCLKEVDVGAYYGQLRGAGLEYGPSFQGINRLWHGDGEALGQVRLPVTCQGETSDYQLHPALLDACFQLSIAAFPEEIREAEFKEAVYLPVGFKRLCIYQSVPDQLWAHAFVLENNADNRNRFDIDLRLFDELGQMVAEVQSLYLKRASRGVLQRVMQPEFKDWLYEVNWQPQDAAAENEAEGLADQSGGWLIFADESGVGAALSKRLQAQGAHCVQVVAGESFVMSEDGACQVNRAEPSDFVHLLEAFKSGRPLRGVVYLWGIDSQAGAETDQAPICGGLLYLVQALAGADNMASTNLWIVTRGVQAVGAHASTLSVGQAPLWGLGGTISNEHPELGCVRVDLDPRPEAEVSEALFKEIWFKNEETQVAFRHSNRYVARLVRSRLPENTATEASTGIVRADATYLITGGLGGLGLKVAEWLAAQGARHLVLVGRRGASGAAVEQIRKMEEVGVQVVVAQADVSIKEQVKKVVAGISDTMPPLRGVVHSAGVLADAVLFQQNWERFAKVFAPKVNGAWYLHSLTKDYVLDFFVLFSSTAPLLGAPGQGNYAGANAFLDTLAHHRQAQGLPALSINWGPWAEVGMVASAHDRDQRRLMDQGMRHIFPEQGVTLLMRLLKQAPTQIAVLPINWIEFSRYYPKAAEAPYFSYLIQKDEFPSNVGLKESITQKSIMTGESIASRQSVESCLRDQVAEVLKLPAARLDVQQPIEDLGLDSLMALELFDRIEKLFGKKLPLSTLIHAATVEQLADKIADGEKSDAGLNDSITPKSTMTGVAIEGRQSVESSLRDQVAEVLKLPAARIDVQQPIEDLGLDSLMALELFDRIEKLFGKKFPLSTLIHAATVEQLAEKIGDGGNKTKAVGEIKPKMKTIIRQATLADKDAVLNFLKTAYADQGDVLLQKMLKRWTWQYRKHPCIDQKKDDLMILISTKGDQIVGQICRTPVKLKIESQYHTASWGLDYIVLPNYRSEGIAIKLMLTQIEHAKLILSMGAPTTRKIAESIGYKTLDPVPVYRRVVGFDKYLFFRYLMKATKNRPVINRFANVFWNRFLLDKLASAGTNSILGIRNLLERRPKKKSKTDVQEVQNFDERIDQLWSLTNHHYDVIAKRDKEYLNWRYSPHWLLNYRKFIATKNGEIKGYIVLRKEGPDERNFGIIVDLYASRDDLNTIEDLVRHAINFFAKDVVAIECAGSIKEYEKALSSLGFLKVGSATPIIYCEKSSVADKLNTLEERCFFTKGDLDWDQYTPIRKV